MTITVTMPDGADTKPVEFYRALAQLCPGHNIRVHHDQQDTKHLVWSGREHLLQEPAIETAGLLFMTDEALSHCRPEVYDLSGRFLTAPPEPQPNSKRRKR